MLESLKLSANDGMIVDFVKTGGRNFHSDSDFFAMMNRAMNDEVQSGFKQYGSGSSQYESPALQNNDDRPSGATYSQDYKYQESKIVSDKTNYGDEKPLTASNAEKPTSPSTHESDAERIDEESPLEKKVENMGGDELQDDRASGIDETMEKNLIALLGKERAKELIALLQNRDKLSPEMFNAKFAKILKGLERELLAGGNSLGFTKSDIKKLNELLQKLALNGDNSKGKSSNVGVVGDKLLQGEGTFLNKSEVAKLLEQLEKLVERKKSSGKTAKRGGTASLRAIAENSKNETTKAVDGKLQGTADHESGNMNFKEGLASSFGETGVDSEGRSSNGFGNEERGQNLFGSKGTSQVKAQSAPSSKAGNVDFSKNLDAIINRAKITVRDNKNARFTVNLYPRDLGSLNMSLSLENGVVHGKFIVDSDEARNSLLQNMDNLKEQLRESGIDIGDFSVGVRDDGRPSAEDENMGTVGQYSFPLKEEETPTELFEVNSIYSNSQINLVV